MIDLSKIPVVIFCGGRGARFDAETHEKPKPLIEVAGKPMIQHIIDLFVAQGFREFILPTGYLGKQVKNYFAHDSNFYHDDRPNAYAGFFGTNGIDVFVVDTGEDAHVGERLWKVKDLIAGRRFVMTYGDGLSDVNMVKVIEKHDKTAHRIWWGDERPDDPPAALLTLTAVCPEGRFGSIEMSSVDDWGVGAVQSFQEKPRDAWINGGFMIVEPEFIENYLIGDPVPMLESRAMASVACDGLMRAYRHSGYWRCMDTRRDREQIENDVTRSVGKLPWMPVIG